MQNENINVHDAVKRIVSATFTSFTICVLCWSVFWLLPCWEAVGTINILSVVGAIWVSLGICVCVSVLGFVCFSELFAKKWGMTTRYVLFSVFGYAIIAVWVFGSGWCPPDGFVLFTIICVAVFALVGIARFTRAKKSDELLNKQLNNYRQN